MSPSSTERALICAFLAATLTDCSGGGTGDVPSDASSDTSAPAPDGDPAPGPDASGSDAPLHPDVETPDSSTVGISCSGASPSFATTVQPIFQANCGGEMCHNGTTLPTFPRSALVNVHPSRNLCATGGVLVSPGSLADSYLIRKVTGLGMCPTTVKMPKGSTLAASEIQTVADWICSGAKDD